MNDIVERLREYTSSDHARGCGGRCYSCTCGYDDKRDPLLVEAADEIERLRAEVEYWKGMAPPQIRRDFPFDRKAVETGDQGVTYEQKASKTYTAGNGEELPNGVAGTTIVNDGRPT